MEGLPLSVLGMLSWLMQYSGVVGWRMFPRVWERFWLGQVYSCPVGVSCGAHLEKAGWEESSPHTEMLVPDHPLQGSR